MSDTLCVSFNCHILSRSYYKCCYLIQLATYFLLYFNVVIRLDFDPLTLKLCDYFVIVRDDQWFKFGELITAHSHVFLDSFPMVLYMSIVILDDYRFFALFFTLISCGAVIWIFGKKTCVLGAKVDWIKSGDELGNDELVSDIEEYVEARESMKKSY